MNDTVIDMSRAQPERKERSTALAPVADMTPLQVLDRAIQKGLDADSLGKLMALQERWEANQARKAFEAAVAAAKAEIKPVLKTREVDFTSQKGRTHYQYEDLAQIANEIDPILGKYGLSYRHRSKQEAKRLSVTCVLAHRDGHAEETTLSADNDESGNKNSIQAMGSTATYLQRYTLKLALGLSAAKDDDGRGSEQEETISEQQAADLHALITEHGGNLGRLLTYFKIRSLSEIPVKNYLWAVSEVKRLAQIAAEARGK
jgi:hypothetical protein